MGIIVCKTEKESLQSFVGVFLCNRLRVFLQPVVFIFFTVHYIALDVGAWLLTKVTSPVVGATKLHHIEGASKAVDLILTPEEILYLEEPYVPHPLAGVMAQNKPAAAKEKHVWSTGDQKIGK